MRLTHNTVVLRCGAGRMYNEACLVHGDLSEYNILYYESEVFFIDVSQSVEHDHPASFDFLRECSLSCLSWGCFARASCPHTAAAAFRFAFCSRTVRRRSFSSKTPSAEPQVSFDSFSTCVRRNSFMSPYLESWGFG